VLRWSASSVTGCAESVTGDRGVGSGDGEQASEESGGEG
jgi:hypothetical protein